MLGPCAVPRGETILVACSGGPDSLALLLGLAELAPRLGIRLAVAHLDHGMRGKESAADARAVERRATAMGIPIVSTRVQARAEMRRRGLSGEAGLRRLRREFLSRAAAETGAGRIALGHTADDQAETLLLRLTRGSGVSGLAAMRPRTGRWIRPLLEVSRPDVLEFLRDRGARPRRDPSNRSLRFARNRLRHEVLPSLRRLNPSVTEALAAAAARLGQVADVLDWIGRKALRQAAAEPVPGGIRLVRATLLRYHPLVRENVLRQAWAAVGPRGRGVTRHHLQAVEALLVRGVGGTRVHLPADRVARLDRGLLFLGPAASRAASN